MRWKTTYIVMYVVKHDDPETLLRIDFLLGEIKAMKEEVGKESFQEPT